MRSDRPCIPIRKADQADIANKCAMRWMRWQGVSCFPRLHRAADLTHLRWLEKSQWPNASWPGNNSENERKVRNPHFLPRRLLITLSRVHFASLVPVSFRFCQHDVAGADPKPVHVRRQKQHDSDRCMAFPSLGSQVHRWVGGTVPALLYCSARLFSSL